MPHLIPQEIAGLLIDRGRRKQKSQCGYPPIQYAVDYPDMVATLLNKGADPNQTFCNKKTYIITASSKNWLLF